MERRIGRRLSEPPQYLSKKSEISADIGTKGIVEFGAGAARTEGIPSWIGSDRGFVG